MQWHPKLWNRTHATRVRTSCRRLTSMPSASSVTKLSVPAKHYARAEAQSHPQNQAGPTERPRTPSMSLSLTFHLRFGATRAASHPEARQPRHEGTAVSQRRLRICLVRRNRRVKMGLCAAGLCSRDPVDPST